MPGDPHTVRSFDQDINRLNQTIAHMGGLAETQLVSALQAMEQGDAELAARVISADGQVDGDENSINEQVVRLLALRQPVADDLRLIMSSLKVASALERIADHATSMAHRVEVLRQAPHIPAIRSVLRLGWLVRDLLKASLDAFLAQDTERAQVVRDSDREVDDLYSSLFRELLTYMMEDPRNITPCTHLMFIAKNLERVGDHATNLAEITCFIVTGKALTDQRPKADQSSSIGL